MPRKPDGVIARLGPYRWIGIDYGSGDTMTETEVQFYPDGSMTVLDIRETPTPLNKTEPD